MKYVATLKVGEFRTGDCAFDSIYRCLPQPTCKEGEYYKPGGDGTDGDDTVELFEWETEANCEQCTVLIVEHYFGTRRMLLGFTMFAEIQAYCAFCVIQ
jgi:hypothetical protein